MQLQYKDYGFYKIDIDYLKYLNSIDNQVFFKEDKNYDRKPHLGLIVGINEFKYCIPLTSAKLRHLGLKKHILISLIKMKRKFYSSVDKGFNLG